MPVTGDIAEPNRPFLRRSFLSLLLLFFALVFLLARFLLALLLFLLLVARRRRHATRSPVSSWAPRPSGASAGRADVSAAVAFGLAGAPVVLAVGGSPAASTETGVPTSLPKMPARRSPNECPPCRRHSVFGCVPRTKYSVYTIDRFSLIPSRFTTSTLSQPPDGSFPDMRHTLRPTTFAGRSNQSGFCPRVARFMKSAQMGTASSPAYPPDAIVLGLSKPTQTPVTRCGV